MWKILKKVLHPVGQLVGEKWLSFTLPYVIGFALIAIIYGPDQVVSLGKSLFNATNPINEVDRSNQIGFVPDFTGIILWWICSSLVVICLWFTTESTPQTNIKNQNGKRVFWPKIIRQVTPYILSHLLILAPLFLSISFFTGTWLPAASIVLTGLCLALLAIYYGVKHVWVTLSLIVIVICFTLATFPVAAVVIITLPIIFQLFSWLLFRHEQTWQQRIFIGSLMFIPVVFTGFVSLSFTYRFYSYHPIYNVVILALWWIVPMLLNFFIWAKRSPKPEQFQKTSWFLIIFLMMILFVCPLLKHIYALNTLCLLTCLVLLVLRASKTHSTQMTRGALLVVVIIFMLQAWQLNPSLNLLDAKTVTTETTTQLGSRRGSAFGSFYHQWLKQRGESESDRGPIILLAISGGGMRAAAHSGLSLMAADEATKGMFGDRVMAVSAVSGGALGAMAWLDSRDVLFHPSQKTPEALNKNPYELTWQLAKYFSNDFVSPVVGSMISEDFFRTLMPFASALPSRDIALADKWRIEWRRFLEESKSMNSRHNLFSTELKKIYPDGTGPMIIFNTTSVTDSSRAVYSNVDAKFNGALRLASNIATSDAALDSSRFAVVSPIGESCTRDPINGPQKKDFHIHCKKGTFPISIADGGYSDNSGLASIDNVLDELKEFRPDLDNVFIISITSNPEKTLPYKDGTRFSNNQLLPQILSPLFILESARSGRPQLYENFLKTQLNQGSLITWDLSLKIVADTLIKASGPASTGWLSWYENWDKQRYAEMRLAIPPLGWTLDSNSIHSISISAISHLPYFVSPSCNLYEPTKTLCVSLEIAKTKILNKKELNNERSMLKNY